MLIFQKIKYQQKYTYVDAGYGYLRDWLGLFKNYVVPGCKGWFWGKDTSGKSVFIK